MALSPTEMTGFSENAEETLYGVSRFSCHEFETGKDSSASTVRLAPSNHVYRKQNDQMPNFHIRSIVENAFGGLPETHSKERNRLRTKTSWSINFASIHRRIIRFIAKNTQVGTCSEKFARSKTTKSISITDAATVSIIQATHILC